MTVDPDRNPPPDLMAAYRELLARADARFNEVAADLAEARRLPDGDERRIAVLEARARTATELIELLQSAVVLAVSRVEAEVRGDPRDPAPVRESRRPRG